ncbi:MAG: LytTR family transcriptional regulator [Rubellimicrobium sp.]|nr:LytTR family transcriptional regulator [Rubellimicrobium sp.]
MANKDLSFALRESRSHLGNPVVLAVMAAVSVVLGFSGPFSTLELLRAGPRLAYWTVVVFLTYGAGTVVTQLLDLGLRRQGRSLWQRAVLLGLANGFVATVLLLGLNWLAFGDRPRPLSDMAGLYVFVTTVSLCVAGLHALVEQRDKAREPEGAAPPPILSRLPLDRRGQLVALTVQDHYVQVQTTAGAAILLMRLSDAMAETAPEPGLQVHRSHWVALAQVSAARRTGDSAVLTLSTGQDVPVSRGKLAAVQAAGLLPARATGVKVPQGAPGE